MTKKIIIWILAIFLLSSLAYAFPFSDTGEITLNGSNPSDGDDPAVVGGWNTSNAGDWNYTITRFQSGNMSIYGQQTSNSYLEYNFNNCSNGTFSGYISGDSSGARCTFQLFFNGTNNFQIGMDSGTTSTHFASRVYDGSGNWVASQAALPAAGEWGRVKVIIGGSNFSAYAGVQNTFIEEHDFADTTCFTKLRVSADNGAAGSCWVDTINFTSQYYGVLTILFKNETGYTDRIDDRIVNFELIGNQTSSNYSTGTGSFSTNSLNTDRYTLRYSANGFNERFYYFDFDESTDTTLNVYLGKSSLESNVTATVIDQSGNKVEGAFIKVLKFDASTNTYKIIEIAETNFNGQAIVHLVLNSEFYKFLVEYPFGTQKLVTSPTYIYTTSLNLQINLEADLAEEYFNTLGVTHSLVFNNATNNVRFTYNDHDNLATEGCLYIYRLSSQKPQELYNTSCLSASSGSILIKLDNTTGLTYKAVGYVDFGSGLRYIREIIVSFVTDRLTSTVSIFWLFIIMLLLSCLAVYDRTIALIVTPLPMILWSYLKWWQLPIGLTISFEILAVIAAIVISKRGA